MSTMEFQGNRTAASARQTSTKPTDHRAQLTNDAASEQIGLVQLTNNPIKLISRADSGTELQVVPDALEILSKELRPVTVVVVVGLYRRGKSYLATRLMGKSIGFALGHTKEPGTIGLYFWTRDFPGDPSRCLVVFDVEGLGCAVKQQKKDYEAKLFLISLLSASVFIYNLQTAIDTYSLNGLNFVSNVCKDFMPNADDKEKKCLVTQFPMLVFAVRDFTLTLDNDETPNDYLETCLSKTGTIGEEIKKYFEVRECFLFPHPVLSSKKYKIIEKLDDSEIDEEFTEELNRLLKYIEKKVKPNKMGTEKLTGLSFAELFKKLVMAVNNKNLVMGTLFETTEKDTNDKAFATAIQKFTETLTELKTRYPVSQIDFDKCIEKSKEEAEETFARLCLNFAGNIFKQNDLKQKIESMSEDEMKENISVSEKKCKELIEKLYEKISKKFSDRQYSGEDASIELKEDLDEMKAQYEEHAKKNELGPCKDDVYKKFEENEASHLRNIILSAERQHRVDWILTLNPQKGVKFSEEEQIKIEKLNSAFKKAVEARKETLKALSDMAVMVAKLEKKVRYAKTGATALTIAGSILGIAAGITLLCATGGLAAPAVGAVFWASMSFALAGGTASIIVNRHDSSQQEELSKRLRRDLTNDVECFFRLRKKLKKVQEIHFAFQLQLKGAISENKFRGTGISELESRMQKSIPAFHEFKFRERSSTYLLNNLLNAAEIQYEYSKTTKELFKAFFRNGAEDVASTTFREISEEVIKIAAGTTVKVLSGGLAIAFGCVFIYLDVKQLCKEWKKDSIAEAINTLADDISHLPKRGENEYRDENGTEMQFQTIEYFPNEIEAFQSATKTFTENLDKEIPVNSVSKRQLYDAFEKSKTAAFEMIANDFSNIANNIDFLQKLNTEFKLIFEERAKAKIGQSEHDEASAIQSNEDDMLDLIEREINETAYQSSIQHFKEYLDKTISVYPVSNETLEDAFEKSANSANDFFIDSCVNLLNNNVLHGKLNMEFLRILKERDQKNIKESHIKCKAFLNNLFESNIVINQNGSRYVGQDGLNHLNADLKEMKAKYEESEELGPCKSEVYRKFEKVEVAEFKANLKLSTTH